MGFWFLKKYYVSSVIYEYDNVEILQLLYHHLKFHKSNYKLDFFFNHSRPSPYLHMENKTFVRTSNSYHFQIDGFKILRISHTFFKYYFLNRQLLYLNINIGLFKASRN